MTHYREGSAATTVRRLLIVIAVAIAIAVVPFVSGLVGGLILFAITRRLHARVSRRVPPRVSALVISTGSLAAVLLVGGWLVTTIASEAAAALHEWKPEELSRWLKSTPLDGIDLTKEISGAASALVGWASSRGVQLVGGATTAVLNVLLALFGLYYLLLDAPSLWARVKRVLSLPDEIADLLASRFAAVTDALMLGTLLTAVLQGTIVGIAFAIVGLHPAVLWGFVTACAAILPLLGSGLVWLPGIIVLLVDHRYGAAALLAFFGAGIASNIDNLVRLVVYRRVSGIHPMLTLLGAFAGVRMLGIVGVFIGPLVLSCFVELLGVYEDTVLNGGTVETRPA
jgi:predicted PurR-regulated permease PerM